MKNNLSLITSAAKELSSTATSLVSTYRELRNIKKSELITLQENIRTLHTLARARALGEIVRTNIEELSLTEQKISAYNFSPRALEMALLELEFLSRKLLENLKEYTG